jgi:hypothetical protein
MIVEREVVGQDQQRVYSAVVWSSGSYGNFYDYYSSSWATVTPIGKGHIDATTANALLACLGITIVTFVLLASRAPRIARLERPRLPTQRVRDSNLTHRLVDAICGKTTAARRSCDHSDG